MIFIGYEFNLKWNFRYTKMVEIVQAIIVIILLASAATGKTSVLYSSNCFERVYNWSLSTVYMVKVVTGGDVHLHKAKVNKESRVDSDHRPVYLFSVITQPLCQGIRRCTKREDIIQEQWKTVISCQYPCTATNHSLHSSATTRPRQYDQVYDAGRRVRCRQPNLNYRSTQTINIMLGLGCN